MLPNTVRRVVSVPPTPLVSSIASASAPRTAAAVGASRPFRHQRRCSSSKPSSSDNGPKDMPGQSAAVPASASSRSGETKASSRKRKSKDSSERNASSQKLPSVPSTQHLSPEALGLSTFFSLHRPISVTHSMPKSITEEAFATIFNMRNKPINPSEVLSTLSRTADDLDGAMAKMTISEQPEPDANGDPVRKVDFQHADGTESSVYLQLNAMAGQFAPFRPPPAPKAKGASSGSATADPVTVEAVAEELLAEAPHHRVYKALFTIEESTDSSGEVRVVAHSPRIVNDEAPRTFLERMARRQVLFDEAQPGDMQAISVRRQRKLKMKKHKYKKLMRRTRNLRRKLDRL